MTQEDTPLVIEPRHDEEEIEDETDEIRVKMRPSKETASSGPYQGVPRTFILLFTVAGVLLIVSCGVFFLRASPIDKDVPHNGVPLLGKKHKTTKTKNGNQIPVVRSRDGFPSFLDYSAALAKNRRHAMDVSYDGRSLMINGDRILLLGGSMHPSRATRATWEAALDQAVTNGLNLITIYVFWSAHQRFSANSPYDWRLNLDTVGNHDNTDDVFRDDWTLADAIESCAARGFFVHIRVGPYNCAEYSYGGIPEWLPLQYPNMSMRRYDPQWMQVMEEFIAAAYDYFSEHGLWAQTNGGPIILTQIENELGDDEGGFMSITTRDKKGDPAQTLGHSVQEYADWCGAMAARHAPAGAVLTMCNGLAANNTILTYNGDGSPAIYNGDEGVVATWLENHGATGAGVNDGRILIDQPAMWTEFEGGYQLWGEDAAHPTDYFWGQTAHNMAYEALQWFARGGSHLNYYMWWGGYNRGRTAAGGMLNAYATDVLLCPSGQPHYPKFDHLQALHEAVRDVADVLLASFPNRNETVEFWDDNKTTWKPSSRQVMSVYTKKGDRKRKDREVIILENNLDSSVLVRFPTSTSPDRRELDMMPRSAMLIVDGAVKFDSSTVNPSAMSYSRKFIVEPVQLQDWMSWNEPVNPQPGEISAKYPVEQTALVGQQSLWTDYVWYETAVSISTSLSEDAALHIETQKANGFVVFVDGVPIGAADNHEHGDGHITLNISLPHHMLPQGNHTITLLSESFGYHNLIGRWGANTGPKTKGITGDVMLSWQSSSGRHKKKIQLHEMSLVDGRLWSSRAGLLGEWVSKDQLMGRSAFQDHMPPRTDTSSSTPVWWSVRFPTPQYDPEKQGLFLDVTAGRGHLWLNGRDLGRYWNITRGETSRPSVRYYILPPDYLSTDEDQMNEVILFDAFGNDLSGNVKLVVSGLEVTDQPNFPDEVEFPNACI